MWLLGMEGSQGAAECSASCAKRMMSALTEASRRMGFRVQTPVLLVGEAQQQRAVPPLFRDLGGGRLTRVSPSGKALQLDESGSLSTGQTSASLPRTTLDQQAMLQRGRAQLPRVARREATPDFSSKTRHFSLSKKYHHHKARATRAALRARDPR